MSVPTPAIFANRKAPVVPAPPVTRVIAAIEPTDPGKRVTLGVRDEVFTTVHDGVVKTKALQRGQRVRPWVHGEARGGERIVAKVTKIDDGTMWRVEWASAHPTQDYKAAYRWFDASLEGADVQHVRKVPAFVPAHGKPEGI